MSDNLSKILNIFLYALLGISIVVVALFYMGASKLDSEADALVQLEQISGTLEMFVDWTYVLMAIATLAAFAFPLVNVFTNKKAMVQTGIVLAVLFVVIGISYALADNTTLVLPGYTGTDNVSGTLKWAGTSLYTMYILGILAIGGVFYTEISKIFK